MRVIAILGSSLLAGVLLAAAPGQQQQRPDRAADAEKLRALAAAPDADAREAILKSFDDYPISWLNSAPMLLAMFPRDRKAPDRSTEDADAVRRWLPHGAWSGQVQKVGQARERERKLVGDDAKQKPGDFARALQKVLDEGDLESKKTALRLYANLPAPAPEKLLPFLKSEDRILRRLAAAALAWSPAPEAAREVLKVFLETPAGQGLHLVGVLSGLGSSELTPDLVDILKNQPALAPAIIQALDVLADGRAEAALIEYLPTEKKSPSYGSLQALSILGGPAAVEAIRGLAAKFPAGDERRPWCRNALVRLRAPGLAAELWTEVRDGITPLEMQRDDFERLGDRSILPDLVAYVKDRKLKIEQRRHGLRLLGKLGDSTHRALLEEHLTDARFEAAAAEALEDLGDPAAAPALAHALKTAEDAAHDITRALLSLNPSPEAIDAPLAEILADPQGHSRALRGAIDLGVRFGSPRIRSLVLEAGTSEARHDLEVAHVMALLPSLTPEDRKRLEKGSSGGRSSYIACLFGLAALGDAKALKELVDFLPKGAPYYVIGAREPNLLNLFPKDPEGLAERIEETFVRSPRWYDGADWLYRHGNRKGADLLLEKLRGPLTTETERAALALLRGGDLNALPDILQSIRRTWVNPELAELLARALPAEDAARLRDEIWDRIYFMNPPALRILALRDDPAMIPYFRKKVRGNYIDNDVSPQVSDGAEELFLARLRVPGVDHDFIRALRSRAPGRRMLAARCLGMLRQRSAIPALEPLLDDVQEQNHHTNVFPDYERRLQVREAAADAIGLIAGVTFAGSPGQRAKAAKEWIAKNRTQ